MLSLLYHRISQKKDLYVAEKWLIISNIRKSFLHLEIQLRNIKSVACYTTAFKTDVD